MRVRETKKGRVAGEGNMSKTERHIFVAWSEGLRIEEIKAKWPWADYLVCIGTGLLGFENEKGYKRYRRRLRLA